MAITTGIGIGSGLDIQSLVSQLVSAEGRAPSRTLAREETRLQTRLSAIGKLQSALSSFQTSIGQASDTTKFNSKTTNIVNSDLFSASATSTAVAGTYSVEVQQLAQSHKLASQGFAALDTTVSTGTLTIEFGTDNAGVFTANPNKTAQNITIDTTNNTIAGVRDAINNANIGVRASIVFNGTDYQLTLSSEDTGAVNSLRVSGIAELVYDPANLPGSNMTTTAAAQDAQIVIDGINITSDKNTISTAIDGVTLNLKSANVGNPTNLTINEDTNSAFNAVKSFVSGYNDLMKTINSLSAYNADTETGGPLIGDSTIRSVVMQIQRAIATPVDGLTGKYRFMGDVGIATTKDGTLSLDESKLRAAIDADMESVGRIFSDGATVTDPLVKYVSSTSKTTEGRHNLYISSYTAGQAATSGVYTGNLTNFLDPAAGSYVIGNNENNFTISVDGVVSNNITLTSQTYATGAALATEIQNQINADSNLVAAGVSVSVAYNSVAAQGQFIFTSNSTGASSDVLFTAEDPQTLANLGFSSTTMNNVLGQDQILESYTGTLGGEPFTYDNGYITGSGVTEGLKLQILGGGTGNRGAVTFTRGLASRLNVLTESYTESGGVLSSRTEILNNGLKSVTERRAALETRLQDLEKRYTIQFSKLDALLGTLNSQSQWLTQQLASIPKIGK